MSKQHVPTVAIASHEGLEATKARSLFRKSSSCTSRLRGLRVSRRLAVGACVAAVLASSACVTTTGDSVVERPALEVPPPPPRVITPLPVPEPPPAEPVVEDPAEATPATPAKPRPQPATPNTGKPEAKPETAPTDAAPPPATPPAATPPQPTLSTPAVGDANAISRQIRDGIERTRRALESIDYRPLSNGRKKAYDDAKLFATQAEDALKASNLVFAKELADKAERLAKELQGR